MIRPCDAAETAVAWEAILKLDGPACLVLSRQALPVLDRATLAPAGGLVRGGYVLAAGSSARNATIVATGSEVEVALAARDLLALDGVAASVVSMPSLELFASQSTEYRQEVLPSGVPSVSVEAGLAQGWERWVDHSVSIDRFGASAPGAEVLERLGITAATVRKAVLSALERSITGR